MKTLFSMVTLTTLLINSPSYSQIFNNESTGLSDTEIKAAYCVGVLNVIIGDVTNGIGEAEKRFTAVCGTSAISESVKKICAGGSASIAETESAKGRLTAYLFAKGLLNNSDKSFGFVVASNQGSQDVKACMDWSGNNQCVGDCISKGGKADTIDSCAEKCLPPEICSCTRKCLKPDFLPM